MDAAFLDRGYELLLHGQAPLPAPYLGLFISLIYLPTNE